jgi:hypothetical protein
MAKKGIMYYVTMSFGGALVGYLFYANKGSMEKNKEFESLDDMYKKFEGKQKLVTQNELRLMGERNKVEDVPVADSDEKSGYM